MTHSHCNKSRYRRNAGRFCSAIVSLRLLFVVCFNDYAII